jgi:hypothetical protein
MAGDDPLANADKGEGSYKGTKDYQKNIGDYLRREGDRVQAQAEEAKDALEGDEGAELERAEQEGKSHAKK